MIRTVGSNAAEQALIEIALRMVQHPEDYIAGSKSFDATNITINIDTTGASTISIKGHAKAGVKIDDAPKMVYPDNSRDSSTEHSRTSNTTFADSIVGDKRVATGGAYCGKKTTERDMIDQYFDAIFANDVIGGTDD